MPQYESVIRSTHPIELTAEDGDKTLFEKQCEELEHELNERKRSFPHGFITLRMKAELEEAIKVKRQRVLVSMHLKHKTQNVAHQQLEKLDEVGKSLSV